MRTSGDAQAAGTALALVEGQARSPSDAPKSTAETRPTLRRILTVSETREALPSFPRAAAQSTQPIRAGSIAISSSHISNGSVVVWYSSQPSHTFVNCGKM